MKLAIYLYLALFLFTGCQDNGRDIYIVKTNAMSPTINLGDKISISNIAQNRVLSRGDLVLFRYPDRYGRPSDIVSIMRVVGLPGEEVQLTNSGIFINDELNLTITKLVNHRFGAMPTIAIFGVEGPFELKADEYYVMGDNYSEARDSRVIGQVQREDIIGLVADYPNMKKIAEQP